MSDSNLLESGILKKLLGLRDEFFSDLRKTWNPEEVDIKVAIQMKMRQEFAAACSEDNPSIGSYFETINTRKISKTCLTSEMSKTSKRVRHVKWLRKIIHF
jgi:hypothetical protein